MSDPIVIVAAARTPMGGLGGALATATAAELGGAAIAAALARASTDRVVAAYQLLALLGQ
mgnify:CR=1 FL=1